MERMGGGEDAVVAALIQVTIHESFITNYFGSSERARTS
jgi:hypothetical protein